MKKVFSSIKEAVHIYANDPYREGRASSVTFKDGVLFSYNTAISHHVINEKGESAFIVNRQSYSNTTSKQQGQLAYALNHQKTIPLRFISYDTQSLNANDLSKMRLIELYEKEAQRLLIKASKARLKGDDYRAAAYHTLNELKAYFDFFGIDYDIGDIAMHEAIAIENDKIAKELEKKRTAERIAYQKEALEKWRNGENVNNYFEITALRLNGENVETTKGAKVPIEHAIKLWPLINRLHEKGETYHANGHSIHLGHYTVNSFEKDILTVGCHKIPFSELSAIAEQLNLYKEVI